MPTNLRLTLACGAYDINQALIDGAVTPQGIDLTVLTYPSPERHWRMARSLEFDACEFSIGSYLILHDRAAPVTAVPAFPHRRFRHRFVFVNAAAGIDRPKDLEGRRVGVRTWQTSAGLVARGILQDDHDVDLATIDWVAQDEEDLPLADPSRFAIRRAPADDTVTAMLERGELDALIYPDVPDAIVRGDPRVRRLFEDPKAVEMDHVARTGMFPIMHTVLVRRPVVDDHPWVARNLLDAFEASRARAFAAMRDPRRVSLAWFEDAWQEQVRVLGNDPWRYEFEANRAQLETLIRWSHEQGMIGRRFAPEELFAPTTLERLPTYV